MIISGGPRQLLLVYMSANVDRVALELNQLLTSFSQSKPEHLVIEVSLHVLVPLLELSDHNFLPRVEVCRVRSMSLIQICPVIHTRASARHTFHVENGVRVDYRDYRDYDQARARSNQ